MIFSWRIKQIYVWKVTISSARSLPIFACRSQSKTWSHGGNKRMWRHERMTNTWSVNLDLIYKWQNITTFHPKRFFFTICFPSKQQRSKYAFKTVQASWISKSFLRQSFSAEFDKMYARYLKITISCASFTFVAGFISLMVLSVTKVLPARKGLSFEQTTCRVTHSEFSCDMSSGKCICGRKGNENDVLCLKVFVLCGSATDEVINGSLARNETDGYLLRKDVYHLNDEVKIIQILVYVCIWIKRLSSKTSIHEKDFRTALFHLAIPQSRTAIINIT